eukprot:EG_transcript_5249
MPPLPTRRLLLSLLAALLLGTCHQLWLTASHVAGPTTAAAAGGGQPAHREGGKVAGQSLGAEVPTERGSSNESLVGAAHTVAPIVSDTCSWHVWVGRRLFAGNTGFSVQALEQPVPGPQECLDECHARHGGPCDYFMLEGVTGKAGQNQTMCHVMGVRHEAPQGSFFTCGRDLFGQVNCAGSGRFQYFVAEAMVATEPLLFGPAAADRTEALRRCLRTSNRSTDHIAGIPCEAHKGKAAAGVYRTCREWRCYGDPKWYPAGQRLVDWLRRNKGLGDGQCDAEWDCAGYAYDEGDCIQARRRDRQLRAVCTAWRPPNETRRQLQRLAGRAPRSSGLADEERREFRFGLGAKAALYALQHPPDCARARFVVAERHGGSGFGSRMWFYRMCLTKAFVLGRVFLQLWPGPPDFQHLQPWTNCTPATRQAAAAALGADSEVPCSWPRDVPQWLTATPPQYAHFGLLWWQSQAISYLLRPDPDLLQLLASNGAFLPRPYAGMHVRYHPLKKAESGRRQPFKNYLRMVPQGWKTIFMSVDKNVSSHTAKYPEFDYIYKAKWSKGTDVLVDMMLLAASDRLVFTYSSCFGQMAMHLQLGADFCRPVHAVDNFHHTMGVSLHLFREDELEALPVQLDPTGQSDEALDRCVALLRKADPPSDGLGTWRDHWLSLQPGVAATSLRLV